MMLSVAALSAPALSSMAAAVASSPLAASVVAIFSPSQHPFMKRVANEPNHYSFDPYKMVRAQFPDVFGSSSSSSSANTSKPISASSSFVVTSPSSEEKKQQHKASAEAKPVAVVTAEEENQTQKKMTIPFRLVSISFKRGVATYRAPFRLCEGDVVIVEGDRGEHIGTVKSVMSASETERIVLSETEASSIKGRIIRRASAADLEALAEKTTKETDVLASVNKAAKDVRLNATVVDVEYQFDNNKLTVYVERATSSTFVDFRKVQRVLYKMFHCRIWFVYMDELVE